MSVSIYKNPDARGDDFMSSSEKCEHAHLVFTTPADEHTLLDLLCRVIYEAQQTMLTDEDRKSVV